VLGFEHFLDIVSLSIYLNISEMPLTYGMMAVLGRVSSAASQFLAPDLFMTESFFTDDSG
jgi:hypothetical protein